MDGAVRIKRLRGSRLPLPAYQSAGAAGVDLRADLEQPLLLRPMERRAVPTGSPSPCHRVWKGSYARAAAWRWSMD